MEKSNIRTTELDKILPKNIGNETRTLINQEAVIMKKISMIIICLAISACTTIENMSARENVKPWEKDVLAQPAMQLPQDKMFSYSNDHIYFSKEASTGGTGVGGGGCGCN